MDIEQPVIGVSIKYFSESSPKVIVADSHSYRLGFFGFLASDELGVSGNVGFKDATCAFRWVYSPEQMTSTSLIIPRSRSIFQDSEEIQIV